MRQILRIAAIAILLAAFTPTLCMAEQSTPNAVTTVVSKRPAPRKGHRVEFTPVGQRKPSSPIPCTISASSGVNVDGCDTDDIISYEIYDCYSDALIYQSGFEDDFIETLLSLDGEHMIAFTTADYVYIGYILIGE